MKTYSLSARPRKELGRKVKRLRAQGDIPATIYGKSIKSQSVAVSKNDFIGIYEKAGETGLVELSLEGKTRPVLIHTVQTDPVTDVPLHVEFHQVDLKQKVKANIPLEMVHEAPAVTQKVGVLLTVLTEVEVEALPSDLPEKITVDVSALAQVDDEITVANLKIPAGVTLLTDTSLTVVKVGQLVSKEAEAQAAEEAAAAAQAAEEGKEEEEREEGVEEVKGEEEAAGESEAKEKEEPAKAAPPKENQKKPQA